MEKSSRRHRFVEETSHHPPGLNLLDKSLQSKLFTLAWTVSTVLLSTVTLPFLILLLILLSPIFIYRWIVSIVAPIFIPTIGSILNAQGSMFAVDSIHSSPQCNLLVSLHLEQWVEVEEIRDIFQNKILKEKHSNGKLKYPEFRQVLRKRGGFFFFERDPNFDVKNHVRNFPEAETEKLAEDKSVLEDLENKMISSPFKKGQPLWEFLVANFPDNRGRVKKGCIIFIRMHHSMSDGYSILYLLTKYFGGLDHTKLNIAKAKYEKKRKLDVILWSLRFPFKAVFMLCRMLTYPMLPSISLPFLTPIGERKQMHYHRVEPVTMADLGKIKNNLGVRFTSVMFEIVTGAVRNFMLKARQDTALPPFILCALPFPMENRSGDMGNHFTGAISYFPVGEPDLIKRLEYCDEEFNDLRESVAPLTTFLIFKSIGSMFSSAISPIMRATTGYNSITISSFPAGNESMSFLGSKCTGITFGVGIWKEKTGIAFHMLTYEDKMHTTIMGDEMVITKDELAQLGQCFQNEVKNLLEAAMR